MTSTRVVGPGRTHAEGSRGSSSPVESLRLCHSLHFLNLHRYFQSFGYFVNVVGNLKVPESNKDDRKMLTWIISDTHAGGGGVLRQVCGSGDPI